MYVCIYIYIYICINVRVQDRMLFELILITSTRVHLLHQIDSTCVKTPRIGSRVAFVLKSYVCIFD